MISCIHQLVYFRSFRLRLIQRENKHQTLAAGMEDALIAETNPAWRDLWRETSLQERAL